MVKWQTFLEILGITGLASIARALLLPKENVKKTIISFVGAICLGSVMGVLAYQIWSDIIWAHTTVAAISSLVSENLIKFFIRSVDSSSININKDL